MTLRSHETHTFEALDGFIDEFGVTGKEIMKSAIPEKERENIISEYNDLREDWGTQKAENIDDLPEFVYDEWEEWFQESPQAIIMEVLEARDKEYLYEIESTTVADFHKIVELK